MTPFVHETQASRIVFGAGARARIGAELEGLGLQRALVLTTPEQSALGSSIADMLGSRCAGTFNGAVMHVPVEAVRQALADARELKADGYIAVGGGSTIGLAKAIALETGLPIVALPTTYAGSEMTPLYGLTEAGEKKTGRDWRVAPRSVIYDPELTLSLPVPMSMTSGMNAIAHAAEALYAVDASPIHKLMATEGIRALSGALQALKISPTDIGVRGDAQYGAWLCGIVLGSVKMGLHHKICHVLGGSFNLPHAETHSVILPYALAYNATAAPDAMRAVASAIGAEDAVEGIIYLAEELGIPRSLKALGMPADGLERAADLIVATPYPNPCPIERQGVLGLLKQAFEGKTTQNDDM